jgi:hypothetical protein
MKTLWKIKKKNESLHFHPVLLFTLELGAKSLKKRLTLVKIMTFS